MVLAVLITFVVIYAYFIMREEKSYIPVEVRHSPIPGLIEKFKICQKENPDWEYAEENPEELDEFDLEFYIEECRRWLNEKDMDEDDYTETKTETWQDFEKSVRDEFIKQGMSAKITSGSADGGIDVIVEHNGLTIGVQVKDWQNRVGIKVVGEVLMGMGSYNCDYGCVVARNGYTQPCNTSAIENKITLLDMEDISVYVEKIKRGRL